MGVCEIVIDKGERVVPWHSSKFDGRVRMCAYACVLQGVGCEIVVDEESESDPSPGILP